MFFYLSQIFVFYNLKSAFIIKVCYALSFMPFYILNIKTKIHQLIIYLKIFLVLNAKVVEKLKNLKEGNVI